MKSRILSLAAIAGMLLATGCSGGGAGVTGVSNAPVAPPTGGTPAKGTSSISASFLIPEAALTKATTSNGRSAKYLSPGTGGLDILLGNGTPFTSATGVSGNAQTSNSTTDNAIYPYPAGGAGAPNVVAILTGSYQNGTTPVIGQTLRLVDQSSVPGTTFVSATFTVTNVQAGNTILNGTFNSAGAANANTGYSVSSVTYNATPGVPNVPPAGFTAGAAKTFPIGSLAFFTQTAASANGQQFLVGSQAQPAAFTYAALAPGSVNGIVPASVTQGTAGTFNYTFTPSTQHGYYIFTFTATGLNAATAYTLGVVTFDYNNKYVLSQNQAVITTPVAGGTSNVAFTLRPVVANVYVPAPLPVLPIPDGATPPGPSASTNTLETTVFATDEMGYVIENQTGSVTGPRPDNLPIAGIAVGQGSIIKIAATTAANLTFLKFGATDQTNGGPVAFTAITQSPVGVVPPIATQVANVFSIGNNNAAASDVPALNFAGNFLAMATPALPFTITPVGTFSAGNPLNVTCNTNTSVPWGATLTSAAPGTPNNINALTNTVVGYVITPGTNYPANGATVIALPAVNCVPGIGGVIN